MTMRLELTPFDVVRAYQLHARSQLWSRAMFVSLGVSLAIMAALCVATIRDPIAVAAILACSLAGGLIFPRAMIRWRVPVVARRIYRQQKSLHLPLELVVDAGGVHTKQETGSSTTPWSHYTRLREDDHIVLLYHSDALFQMIPRRFVTEADLAAARGMLGARPRDGLFAARPRDGDD